MRFIHIADVHLGASPDAGKKYSEKRKNEIWDSFRKVIEVCRREETDLLLIAGDLFHRQPLLRELKEVDAMFGSIPHTQVVLVAGNHDYIKKQSYYRNYTWNQNVHMILSDEVSCIQLPTMNLAVYGCSYYEKENQESLYEQIELKDICRYHILLAHGGDASHLPFRKTVVDEIGFDYVAIDRNDIGAHGFVRGILDPSGCRISFVEHAEREYVHLDVPVDEKMTGYDLHTRIDELIGQRGVQNMYCLSLEGRRDPDVAFDLSQMDTFGNVLEIMDHTRPAYDYEGRNQENLLGRYIASFEGAEADSTEYAALCEGVQALLDTRRE